MNLAGVSHACPDHLPRFPDPRHHLLNESWRFDNLSRHFQPERADSPILIVDVAQGESEKIPRKGGSRHHAASAAPAHQQDRYRELMSGQSSVEWNATPAACAAPPPVIFSNMKSRRGASTRSAGVDRAGRADARNPPP